MRYSRIFGERNRYFKLDENDKSVVVHLFIDANNRACLFSDAELSELKGLGKQDSAWGYHLYTDNPDDYLPGEAEKLIPFEEDKESVSIDSN
jgi:hypothetical protein